MDDGVIQIREEAQRLIALAGYFSNARTRAVLLRAAADLLDHVEECERSDSRTRIR